MIQNISNQFNILQKSNPYQKFAFKGETFESGYDITSRAEYPINVLSNFEETDFELDGVQINSIEGFLQSLKTHDINEQKEICKLVGLKAKGMGKKLNKKRNYKFGSLYWQGKPINRKSPEYRELLKRVYEKRFESDAEFRFALEYTKGRVLKHSLGGKDPDRTLLTEEEFTGILMDLRKEHFE